MNQKGIILNCGAVFETKQNDKISYFVGYNITMKTDKDTGDKILKNYPNNRINDKKIAVKSSYDCLEYIEISLFAANLQDVLDLIK